MMSDDLNEDLTRKQGVEDLFTGVPIANSLLELNIPVPRLCKWKPAVLLEEQYSDPDAYYRQLVSALLDTPREEVGSWNGLLAAYGEFLPSKEGFTRTFPDVLGLTKQTEEQIVNTAARSFHLVTIDLNNIFNREGYVFIKINHAQWEEITFSALQSQGKPYFREFHMPDLYARCKIDELVIKSVQLLHREVAGKGYPAGCFFTPSLMLGVSFNNGDYPSKDDLAAPLIPVIKGAMIGSLAFFRAFFPADRWIVADGSAPKSLVWKHECDLFFQRVVEDSDAVVFIVPAHLRKIQIKGWNGPTISIVIPSNYVHELWPSVLPLIAAKLTKIFDRFQRVTILAQAGAMSAPIGMLVQLMRKLFPLTTVRFLDMGQMLDVATYPGSPPGPWMKQPELQPILSRTGSFPISVNC